MKEHGLKGTKKSKATKDKMSKARKKRWLEPGFKDRMKEVTKETWNNPGRKEKAAKKQKEIWKRPGHRKSVSKAIRKWRLGPEGRKKIRDNWQRHQRAIQAKLEKDGWEVFTTGWPDFICLKDDKVRVIEAKGIEKKLTKAQIRTHELLSKLGVKVEVLWP